MEQTTEGTELEITTTEPESGTQTTSGNAIEGEKVELSPEENSGTQVARPTLAEVKAKEQEEAWFNKVIDGKGEMSQVPAWLKPRVQLRLDAISRVPDIKEVAKQVALEEIDKQNQEAEFRREQSELPSMTKEEAAEFQAKFKEFLPLGKVKALQTVKKLYGYDKDSVEERRAMLARGRMSLPPSGGLGAKKGESVLDIAKDTKKWKAFVRSQGSGMNFVEP